MAVTNTCNVALLLVLVASTRNVRFELSNSARVIRTVSVDGGGGGAATGLIVSVALRVTPLNVPLITALIVALTVGIGVRRVTMDATRIRACAAPWAKADSLRFTPARAIGRVPA